MVSTNSKLLYVLKKKIKNFKLFFFKIFKKNSFFLKYLSKKQLYFLNINIKFLFFTKTYLMFKYYKYKILLNKILISFFFDLLISNIHKKFLKLNNNFLFKKLKF
jgi:hypothetical protein